MNEYFSLPLLGYNLKSRIKNFIIWLVMTLCLFILIVVMFMNFLTSGLPSFLGNMLTSMPSSLPEGMVTTSLNLADFGTSFGICMQLVLIVSCVYASYLGASANSNGRGDSDITFVYSLPVTRTCTVFTSYAAQVVTLFFYNIFIFLISFAVLYSNSKLDFLPRLLLALAAFLLIELVYLSLCFMLSTFMSSISQASSVTAVTVAITVLIGLIGSMSPMLKALKVLSPYTYLNVYAIISGNSVPFFFGIVASIIIIIASIAISCVRYDKIDFLLD